jgi:hypothetical protein
MECTDIIEILNRCSAVQCDRSFLRRDHGKAGVEKCRCRNAGKGGGGRRMKIGDTEKPAALAGYSVLH